MLTSVFENHAHTHTYTHTQNQGKSYTHLEDIIKLLKNTAVVGLSGVTVSRMSFELLTFRLLFQPCLWSGICHSETLNPPQFIRLCFHRGCLLFIPYMQYLVDQGPPGVYTWPPYFSLYTVSLLQQQLIYKIYKCSPIMTWEC